MPAKKTTRKKSATPLFIVKLGGSVITDKKEGNKKLDRVALQRIALEIKRARKENPFRLVLVCGVGSFGHTLVQKYSLDEKICTPRQVRGVRETIRSTQKMGQAVSLLLSKAGLKTRTICCTDYCVQSNKVVQIFDAKPFQDAIDEGFIPLTTGTMVPDVQLGNSVLSGDEIIGQLAVLLHAKKALLGTDVDGIYTADPRLNPKARLIRSVTRHNLKAVIRGAGQSQSVDVTKGMKGKIEKIASHLHGKKAIIFNLTKPLVLQRLLCEKTTTSTSIVLRV